MNRIKIPLLLSAAAVLLAACQPDEVALPEMNEETVYVAHVKEPVISTIDANTKELISSVKLDFTVHAMERINETTIALSDETDGTIYTIDTSTSELTELATLEPGITDMVYDEKRDALYVANRLLNEVHFLSIENGETLHAQKTDDFPTHIALADDQLLILSGSEHTVTIVDPDAKLARKKFTVLERPAGLHVSGDHVWIGGHGPNGDLNTAIHGYSLTTGEETDTIEVGLMPVDFFSDEPGRLAVVCHGSDELYDIDLETKRVAKTIATGQNPNVLSGNKDYLFVSNLDSDTITIVNRNTFEIEKELAVAAGPYLMLPGGITND